MDIYDIRKIETSLRIEIPQYYKDYLLNYPYKLTHSGLELELDDIYCPENSEFINDSDKLIEVNKDLQDSIQYWSKDNIIIGIDWCGDFFFLDLSVPVSPIYYYDHETDESEIFCESMKEFVEYLYQKFKDLKKI